MKKKLIADYEIHDKYLYMTMAMTNNRCGAQIKRRHTTSIFISQNTISQLARQIPQNKSFSVVIKIVFMGLSDSHPPISINQINL